MDNDIGNRRERDRSLQVRNIAYITEIQEKKRDKEQQKKQLEEDMIERQRALKERIVKQCAEANSRMRSDNKIDTDPTRPLLSLCNTGLDTYTENKKKGFIVKKGKKDNRNDQPIILNVDEDQKFKRGARSKTTTNIRDLRQVYGISSNNDTKLQRKTQISHLPIKDNTLPSHHQKINMEDSSRKVSEGVIRTHSKPHRLKLEPISNDNLSPKPNGILSVDRSPVNLNSSILKRNIDNVVNTKPRSFNYITNVDEWLKKNRLDPNAKVFIVNNGYPQIKKALEERGWIENPDFDSNCFHFKFTLRSKDIDYSMLNDNQIVNHFGRATTITTKSGLCKSIKNSIWACNEDPDQYFPKCFESFEEEEYNAFVSYYKLIRAECILKKFISLGEQNNRGDEYNRIQQYLLPTASKVIERRLMDVDDYIDDDNWEELSEKEWEVLKEGEKTSEDLHQIILKQNAKRYEKMMKKKKKKKRKTVIKKDVTEEIESKIEVEEDEEDDEDKKVGRPDIETKMIDIVQRLREKYPQTLMNGSDNIWIVKPSGLSRGRGIKLFNSLAEIALHVKSKDQGWVIQKYIENPLLYERRKLDIRQWVLVTDWNPLTVWFYKECYIRLSSNDYDSTNLKNRFSHLTNNSINKNSKNFDKESGFLSQSEFAEYIKTLGYNYSDPFYDHVQPKMKEIVKNSLMCVQDMIENRHYSSEIYGYDFCLDDQLNVWLIEINSSPAWDYSSVNIL